MQKRVVGCLAAGAALGAARFADLALWIDRDTGLVTAGWVGWRYLALFAFVAAVLLASWRGSWQAGPVVRPGGRVPAGALDVSAALAALCMLEQAVGSFVQAEGGASLVRGALAVVCALWLAALDWYWLTNRRESPAAPPVLDGLAGCGGQPGVRVGYPAQLYDQRFELAPGGTDGGGVAAAGCFAAAVRFAAGRLPARRAQPSGGGALWAAGVRAVPVLAAAPVHPAAGRPRRLGPVRFGAAGRGCAPCSARGRDWKNGAATRLTESTKIPKNLEQNQPESIKTKIRSLFLCRTLAGFAILFYNKDTVKFIRIPRVKILGGTIQWL